MERAAICGVIGALSIAIGTLVVPSENFARQKTNEVNQSATPAVLREYEISDCSYWGEDQTNTCLHTDGTHTSDCPYWNGGHYVKRGHHSRGHHGNHHGR